MAVVGPGGPWGEALALDALAAQLRAAARVLRRGGGGGGGACSPGSRPEPTSRRAAGWLTDAPGADRRRDGRSSRPCAVDPRPRPPSGRRPRRGRRGPRRRPGAGARGRRAGDGGSAWVVVVPGTQEWSPQPGRQPVRPHHRRPGAHRRRHARRGRGGRRPRAGPGAGGSGARPPPTPWCSSATARAASSRPRWRATRASPGGHRVTHLVTSGSPVALFPVPATTRVLSVERGDDPVPRLDLTPNPDRSSWVTVRTPRDGLPVDVRDHRLEGYVATLRVAEAAPRGTVAGLDAWQASAGGVLGRRSARCPRSSSSGGGRIHARDPVLRPGDGPGRRAGARWRPRGRPLPGLPVGAAGLCRARRRAGRPAPAARAGRRAQRRVPRPRAGPRAPVPRRRRDDVRHRRRQPAPRGARGPPRRRAARRAQRRPAARAARHRCEPDHRRSPASSGRAPGTPPTSPRRSCDPGWRRSGAARSAGPSRPRRAPPGAQPGPVHLNVCLREPLAPDPRPPRAVARRPRRPCRAATPWVAWSAATAQPRPAPATGSPALTEVARTLVARRAHPRPRLGERAVAWAAERGHPVVAEPFGSARGAGRRPAARAPAAHRHDWLDAHPPDRVVVVGRPTLSRAVGALLRRPGLRVEVVSEGGQWPDPSHVASAVHPPRRCASAAPPPTADDAGRTVGRGWHAAADGSRMPLPHSLPVAQRPGGRERRRRRAPR